MFVANGSVALLADLIHNFGDALTAVPLAIAFTLRSKVAERRAGLAVVAAIAISAGIAGVEAIRRLVSPAAPDHLVALALAGGVGFAGNYLAARIRTRAGRLLESPALVADGRHARADAYVSLAVVASAAVVAIGLPMADPVIGLAITGAILVVGWDAARQVYRRLMDAVDPSLVGRVEQVLRATPGVLGVGELRLRWIGHRLRAECAVTVDHHLTVVEGHHIAEAAEHRLLHQVPRLTAALVHADPFPHQGSDYHELTRPHAAPACPSTAPAT